MIEETELSISELRRKKRSTGSSEGPSTHENGHGHPHGNGHANGNGKGKIFAEEETWARTATAEEPQPEARFQSAATPNPSPRSSHEDDDAIRLPFDVIRLLDAIKRKFFLCVLAALVFGGIGLSWLYFGQKSQIVVELVHRETPALFRGGSGDENASSFAPPKYTDQAIVNMVQSSDLLRRISSKSKDKVPPAQLAQSILVYPDHDSESIMIAFKGHATPAQAVERANLAANEVVEFTKELQVREARTIYNFLGDKLATVNREIASIEGDSKKTASETQPVDVDQQAKALQTQLIDLETKYEMLKIDLEANNPLNDKLQAARDELAEMLSKYTEEHPFVQRQREKIKDLEAQFEKSKQAGAVPGAGTAAVPSTEPRSDNVHMVSASLQKQSLGKQAEQTKALIERIKDKLRTATGGNGDDALRNSRYQSLVKLRSSLASRQREAELFQENPLGYYSVAAPATVERVFSKGHVKKSFVFGAFGSLFGFLALAGLIGIREIVDDRLKSAADVERATELPVLASLGDLDQMDAAAQRAWAFRTWTILRGKLSASQSQGFVCGIISANHGEGRSTWVKLLTNTANERGLRVLTVSTKPTEEPRIHPHESVSENEKSGQAPMEKSSWSEGERMEDDKTLAPSAFSFPAQIAKQLTDPDNSCPVVHIPLPGWVWNLDRRKQWQNALSHWRKIENLVLLVELPPACEPESVLLAEKLPQVIWLTESGKTTLRETRHHLETLRHGGCNLVGAVLNREPNSFFRNQLSRWLSIAILVGGFSMNVQAAVADPEVFQDRETSLTAAEKEAHNKVVAKPSADQELEAAGADNNSTKGTLFTTSHTHRGEWQKKLTLGPGDVLNLGFFGETNLTKNDIAIGPDGRISYLQATDIMAAGLSVDELRAALDKELSKYYRGPRTIVTPVSFRSKKFYVLGKVMAKGVFTLDRPMTVLEAIAVAKGLETGMMSRNSVDLADLQRSFLIRKGQRIPVDFEKLFYTGDLSQNIPIEPDDFLYFPPTILNEIYVVGEVRGPGVMPYTANATLVAALSERGGMTDRAYKSRVLVVRGSLNHPETFVVNLHDIVDGKMSDFRLQPKDIIYVSSRPFIKAEELLDLAATGFIQSAATAWTGQYIGPFLTKPFLHGIYKND
jgi:protein involved in polysaccharide export with SLBB domain/capsular polysaccharide biosynthesis protein